jgi:hypothetical protein
MLRPCRIALDQKNDTDDAQKHDCHTIVTNIPETVIPLSQMEIRMNRLTLILICAAFFCAACGGGDISGETSTPEKGRAATAAEISALQSSI